MRKTGDKDFLLVLQSLETILQAQTKITKKKSTQSRTPNATPTKKINKKKSTKIDKQDNSLKREIQQLTRKTPSPKIQRKLYKNSSRKYQGNDTYFSDDRITISKKRSQKRSSPTPKKQNRMKSYQSPSKKEESYFYSQQSSPSNMKNQNRHNSPVDYDYDYDDQCFNSNYTSGQLNTLCIFFLRWMKRCTEKIESEAKNNISNESTYKKETQRKNEADEKLIELIEMNQNIQLPNQTAPTLTESNTISIERVNCNPNSKEKIETDQIPNEKIEINVTPKSFKSNHSSSTKNKKNTVSRVSFAPILTPQQEKQYLDYLQPGHKQNHSQGDSPVMKSNKIHKNKKKGKTDNASNFDNDTQDNIISNIENDTSNNNNLNSNNNNTNKNNNNSTDANFIDDNFHNENNNNSNSNEKNYNNDNNIKISSNKINNSVGSTNQNNNSTNNTNSTNENKELSIDSSDNTKFDLEGTSPIPLPNDIKKMPSIGDSDLHNQPNSDEIHYDSYELSEKSLSLLPPRGEGEVKEFNPNSFM